MIEEENKVHYVFIKEFNTFMYNQTLHHGRKHFCRFCLQSFNTAQILERRIDDCFKINGKKMVKMAKNWETVKFKNYTRKIKSPFMIYADFESTLVLENNEKQNPDEYYTNKYQNHVGCNFGYKLVCVDDQFSKSFKLYLGQDAVHKFITSMIKGSKY